MHIAFKILVTLFVSLILAICGMLGLIMFSVVFKALTDIDLIRTYLHPLFQ